MEKEKSKATLRPGFPWNAIEVDADGGVRIKEGGVRPAATIGQSKKRRAWLDIVKIYKMRLFASRAVWPPVFYKALAIHIDQATPGGIV